MAVHYLDDGNDDGTVLGQSATSKIGFYGLTTPIVQPTLTAVSASAATTTLNETRITRIQTALVSLGLVTT
jgi:hypothetical protein